MQIYGLFSSRRHIVLIISNSNQRCDVTTFHRIGPRENTSQRNPILTQNQYFLPPTHKRIKDRVPDQCRSNGMVSTSQLPETKLNPYQNKAINAGINVQRIRSMPFEAVQVRNDRDNLHTNTRQRQMENFKQLQIQNQSRPSSGLNE